MRRHAALFSLLAAMTPPLHGQPASTDYDLLAGEVLTLRIKMLPIWQAGGPDAGWAEVLNEQAESLHAELMRLQLATRMYERFTCDDRRADARTFLREEAEKTMAAIEEKYVVTRTMRKMDISARIRRGITEIEGLYGDTERLLRPQ